ncbi:MAG: DUF4332 domain-containing protein [Bacteroidetes bacterium]|jgi:hypothetical protein|nr:DUF4332 domain-containing protein [Bacteroidota bacterium]
MAYYIDLKSITIQQYKNKILNADLLPGRRMLKENIHQIFAVFEKNNIRHVDDLLALLKTKSKIHSFAEKYGIDTDYLVILAREIKSYRQPPSKLKDIPGFNQDDVDKLYQSDIRDTLQLYEKTLTPADKIMLSEQTGVSVEMITRLSHIADLCRIRWVNHTFAYVLSEAGYHSVDAVAISDYNWLHNQVKKLNEARGLYKGHIGLHDMKLCVEAAIEINSLTSDEG